jgi:hypothetical protein
MWQFMSSKLCKKNKFSWTSYVLNSTDIATIIIATLYQIVDFSLTLVVDIDNLLIIAS